jgi:F-type H+-transporting ATPase subunit epsilon
MAVEEKHSANTMILKILLPEDSLVDRDVVKIVCEAPNGFLCLLPRHVDFTTALVPGILFFTTPDDREFYVAVDDGALVKQGDTVLVSVRNAVMGEELGRLNELVIEHFRNRGEQEEKALAAMNKIEAGFVRRFLDIQHEE